MWLDSRQRHELRSSSSPALATCPAPYATDALHGEHSSAVYVKLKAGRADENTARGLHCCPSFCLFLLRDQLLYTVRICVYTHISDAVQTVYELSSLPNNTAAKHDIYRCGAGLAVTVRIRDIGQKVLQCSFKQEVVASQLLSHFLPCRIPRGG